MMEKVVYLLKLPRENEYTVENCDSLLAALAHLAGPSLWRKLFNLQSQTIALEIVNFDEQIQFQVCLPKKLAPYFESQLSAAYPTVVWGKIDDPLDSWTGEIFTSQLRQNNYFFFPLKTYIDFKEVDPLASVLGLMSKAAKKEKMMAQMVLTGASANWREKAQKYLDKNRLDETGKERPVQDSAAIREKTAGVGLRVGIRLAATSLENLRRLSDAFAIYQRADGNNLVLKQPFFWQKEAERQNFYQRKIEGTPKYQILTTTELASLWHLPNRDLQIANIAWGRGAFSEAPENLPIASGVDEVAKRDLTVFAATEFKNKKVRFGLKNADRRRHVYVIGKTGVGKSTLIANMAIDDIKKGRGVAVIDPHGDLAEEILNYIPSKRLADVIYFNPADREYPIPINPLEATGKVEKELIASSLVAIFYKLYHYSWGPRLEYILRNTVLSLGEMKEATLLDIIRVLTEKEFRQKMLGEMKDQVMRRYWVEEFEKMNEKLRVEAISPILNKVGQFVSSPTIRNIVGQPHSKLDFVKVMNGGKILIANLSQGRIGEDNAALLGAMLITKLQLAAMSRVDLPEKERGDFYLYVDEFQNFATQSFIKILSEARKYRLNITLANQYIGQLSEEVMKAIFGNVGTLIAFAAGARDADFLMKEFGRAYKDEDLVNLPNFKIILRMAIDNLATRPFMADTLALPKCANQNREKIIKLSRERYGKKKIF